MSSGAEKSSNVPARHTKRQFDCACDGEKKKKKRLIALRFRDGRKKAKNNLKKTPVNFKKKKEINRPTCLRCCESQFCLFFFLSFCKVIRKEANGQPTITVIGISEAAGLK